MKKRLWLALFILPFYALGQQNLKNIRKSSWQTFVYSITAVDAEQFTKWDSIPVKRFENIAPVLVAYSDSLNTDTLPIGHYVQINVIDNNVSAVLFNNTNLYVLTINNKNKLQLDVRTKTGDLQTAAQVFFKGKEIKPNKDSKTFWVKQHQLDEAVVKICTPGDTTFIELSEMDNVRQSISLQRKYNYRSTKIYRILNWAPSKIKTIIKNNKRRNTWLGTTGYIIFNQPKYKPLDTVKFKGYVVNKKGKQYKKPIQVFLNYYNRNETVNQLLYTLKPVTDGAFVGEFILADTIPIDIAAQLYFKTASNKTILNKIFKIEDYVLNDLGSFNFKSDEAIYYRNDSLRFTASSKDANGLNVMDATAKLIITTNAITKFYKDSLFVSDTLYVDEKKLLSTTDTRFAVATAQWPAADVTVNAKLIFKNSNNELHEENQQLNFIDYADDIIITQDGDSIKAIVKRNGKEIAATGKMVLDDERAVAIEYPYHAKIDPITKQYHFYIPKNEKTSGTVFDVDENYQLSFNRISLGDTLGFSLSNPYQILVYFSVFKGNKLIATGKESTKIITWKKIMANKRQAYKVRWQYIWAGNEKNGEENIALYYKLLSIKIKSSETIFPGQKDTVKIEVKDYKGAAAANVNLTAVAYNNQLKNDIRVANPPYLAKYKNKRALLRKGFENDGDYILSKQYALGRHTAWINNFHLDTMVYYKLLFPKEHFYDAVTLTEYVLPQLSVNVVEKGIPQEIYLLYINRNLVYYNGATDKANYSFSVLPENVQIGIRLKDKYIEIDSLYMQPNYKHDLSFDINNLPAHSKVTTVEKYWSYNEMNLLERSMWQMKDAYSNNYGFVWQNNNVVKLNGNRQHIVGPFSNGAMTFYNPGDFDISFNFESSYEYSLSKQIARLERKYIFTDKVNKNWLQNYPNAFLKLGDTIIAPPTIDYQKKKIYFSLTTTANAYDYNYYATAKVDKGKLQYTAAKDSSFNYMVLQSVNSSIPPVILNNYYNKVNNITPGQYNLYLITNHNYVVKVSDINISKNGTTCIKMDSIPFAENDIFIDELLAAQQKAREDAQKKIPVPEEKVYTIPDTDIYSTTNGATIEGIVKDKKGHNPIPFAMVVIKGSKIAVSCNAAGEFKIVKLRPGKYILVVNSIGYKSDEFTVNVTSDQRISVTVELKVSTLELNEVVVVGYGTTRKKSLTGSVSMVYADELQSVRQNNINQALAGKVAGIQIRGQSSFYGDSNLGVSGAGSILLHGANAFGGSNGLLYVIDGIVYKEWPKNFDTNNIADVSLLSAEKATVLFGPDAAAGAMVITTTTKTFRKEFRDYAFWQPNFFTDKNGQAAFEVTYPDNITGWQAYVVAMDKKKRVGKANTFIQSYKPIVAQLSVPQFLLEGDSADVIGKMVNYTNDNYTITTRFNVNGSEKNKTQKQLPGNEAIIDEQVVTTNADTIIASYTIEAATGFKDGEERKIPVFKKGTAEALGNFWILQNDTTVNFSPAVNNNELNIYAQNNTLDVLLDEIAHLKEYPYYCMEQIASKLTGYAMEKKIKEQLGQSFKSEKDMNRLLAKLQKSQQFDGGWAWWESGKTNFYITNYVANALVAFRENTLVETNVRNAFLYLQNQLPFLKRDELLAALTTLSNGRHGMNYADWLKQIRFDSLTQHQQWQWVKINQQQRLNYQTELQQLIGKQINTQLGGTHWGQENYTWYSNEIATTVIAFTVLQNEPAYKNILPSIIQYFLERRKSGFWRNTVESASIVSAILPTILETNKNFTQPASLQFSGDTSFTVNHFPYQLHLKNTAIDKLTINKTGGGLVYLTAYQKIFNEKPTPVNDKFIVQTRFEKNGQAIKNIQSGEKVKMIVTVNVLKDADYVMLEIPIPAGCIYAAKNSSWQTYREFYKDKMLLFTESLKTGMHQFQIELEPRHNGTYTLNPAKAELMYYPTFYGRNEMKKVAITK